MLLPVGRRGYSDSTERESLRVGILHGKQFGGKCLRANLGQEVSVHDPIVTVVGLWRTGVIVEPWFSIVPL